ncbi:MAG TPA: hypothetical protein PKV09_04595 [Syntrophales bacterium]|nr:hypothetical protein [Syntrophales bacterium]
MFWPTPDTQSDLSRPLLLLPDRMADANVKAVMSWMDFLKAGQTYLNGLYGYCFDFMSPYWVAARSFNRTEQCKVLQHRPGETARDYLELLLFNIETNRKALLTSFKALNEFHAREAERAFSASLNTILDREGEDIASYSHRLANLMERLVYGYPEAIRDIEKDFGFHFNDGGYVRVAETDRFYLYKVLPRHKGVEVRPKGKPVLIIPPYVLGADILGFLPGEDKSYTHCFANQGIPTYIRIIKDIEVTPAVQTMTGEDDCLDTRHFCEVIKRRHGRPVTLNGYCQGGFVSALNLLSGELDGLVDAFVTCVAPMDGTRSRVLTEYLEHIPERFRDLGYAVKELPNGNRVVDGKVMSWVYKLKSMDREAPLFAFYRDLHMFDGSNPGEVRIPATAAALNYWLIYERSDLPVGITKLSFDSYTKPVSKDGTLPVRLFGRELNFKRLKEKNVKWLICIAEGDDLVDREAALAPLDFVDAEVSVFPKGHGAMATSWSLPTSDCALHTCFSGGRGPVRFQLDLEQETNPAS